MRAQALLGLAAAAAAPSSPAYAGHDGPQSVIPPISAMVPLAEPDTFLLVHDAKDARPSPRGDGRGPAPTPWRCGVLSLDGKRPPAYAGIDVLMDGAERAIDIEAATLVPGETDLVLMLESGRTVKDGPRQAGRLFWVRIGRSEGRYTATVEGHPVLLPRTVSNPEGTLLLGEIEAMTAVALPDAKVMLLLADRDFRPGDSGGGTLHLFAVTLDGRRPGDPVEWARVELRGPFTPQSTWRLCSDLAIDDTGVLYAAAASDPGDAGPFQSRILRLGRVVNGHLLPDRHVGVIPVWGAKVEALCFAQVGPDDTRATMLLWGADNETFGGAIGCIAPAEPDTAAPPAPPGP